MSILWKPPYRSINLLANNKFVLGFLSDFFSIKRIKNTIYVPTRFWILHFIFTFTDKSKKSPQQRVDSPHNNISVFKKLTSSPVCFVFIKSKYKMNRTTYMVILAIIVVVCLSVTVMGCEKNCWLNDWKTCDAACNGRVKYSYPGPVHGKCYCCRF